jgi:hypothetical protein
MSWEGHVTYMGQEGNAYKMLVEKPEGKTGLGKPTGLR